MYITELGNSFPGRAAGRGIFPLGQELFCFFVDLFPGPVDFAIVGFVEGVNVLAGGSDGVLFFLLGDLVTFGEVSVAFGAPGSDRLRVLCIGIGVGVVCGRLSGVGYGAAGSDCL